MLLVGGGGKGRKEMPFGNDNVDRTRKSGYSSVRVTLSRQCISCKPMATVGEQGISESWGVDGQTLYKYCQFKHEVCTNYEFN